MPPIGLLLLASIRQVLSSVRDWRRGLDINEINEINETSRPGPEDPSSDGVPTAAK